MSTPSRSVRDHARRAAASLSREHADEPLSLRLLIAEERNAALIAEMVDQGRITPDRALRFADEFAGHLRSALLEAAVEGTPEGSA